MRVKIYQINGARDEKREKFLGTDARERLHLPQAIDPAIYDEVFNAEIDESTPEEIYRRFNSEGHPLHRGHSLSVSDVVVTENGAYFCDDVGFRQIDFDETQTQKPDNLMRVVYVEPGRPAYEAEIAHDIHAEQKAVGGFIECVYNKTVPFSFAMTRASSWAWKAIAVWVTGEPLLPDRFLCAD